MYNRLSEGETPRKTTKQKQIMKLFAKTSIDRRPTDAGDSIEDTIRKAIASNQPIEGNAPMIYTPAKEGVKPEHDIRTDKHDIALEAMNKYQASDAMKGFLERVETDENGTDGKGNKVIDGEIKKE